MAEPSSAPPPRVLLVEDNEADRVLFCEYLEQAGLPWAVVRTSPTFREGLRSIAEDAFDVVFLDLGLPDRDGLEGLRELRASHPDLPVVVLTGVDDVVMATEAIRGGASDYLLKGRFEPTLLVRVLESATSGLRGRRLREDLLDLLSPRERELALLLATGRGAQECAEDLGISVHTARNHMKSVFRKLGVNSQRELLANLHAPA